MTNDYVKVERAKDATDFRRLIESEPKRPVVYKMKDNERFVAHDKWTLAYFAQQTGDVHVHESCNSAFFNITQTAVWDLASMFVRRKYTWSQLIDKIRKREKVIVSGTDTHIFLGNNVVVEKWRNLWEDVKKGLEQFIPGGTSADTMDHVGFWVSGPGISSQTHWDRNGDHNLNFQIKGNKQFLLWEPMDGQEHLYPMPFRFWHISRIPDPYNVKLENYPLYRYAKPFAVQMMEGDMLFIPARWWHHVSHEGDFNINVTAWYQSQYHMRPPPIVKSFFAPRACQGFFLLFKLIFSVLLALPMMLLKYLTGNV